MGGGGLTSERIESYLDLALRRSILADVQARFEVAIPELPNGARARARAARASVRSADAATRLHPRSAGPPRPPAPRPLPQRSTPRATAARAKARAEA